MIKLLFIDDDQDFINRATEYFEEKYEIATALDIASAKKLLPRYTPDAVILDLLLPDGNGLELLESGVIPAPVIVLTNMGDDDTAVNALSSGVADFCVKPCSFRVLEKRIQLRLQKDNLQPLEFDGLLISPQKRTVFYNGKEISLTMSEYNILYFLIQNKGKPFSTDEIYSYLWGTPSLNTSTIRYHISNLRQKLKSGTNGKNYIATVFGKGYCFDGGHHES